MVHSPEIHQYVEVRLLAVLCPCHLYLCVISCVVLLSFIIHSRRHNSNVCISLDAIYFLGYLCSGVSTNTVSVLIFAIYHFLIYSRWTERKKSTPKMIFNILNCLFKCNQCTWRNPQKIATTKIYPFKFVPLYLIKLSGSVHQETIMSYLQSVIQS